MLPSKEVILKRLEANTNKIEGGCWLWQGWREYNGYGRIGFTRKHRESVHRLSAWMFLGLNINNSMSQANHKVICPNKNCWNPEHLYVGDSISNGTDEVTKRTACSKGHEFSEQNTYYKLTRGKVSRNCRICCRISLKKSYQNKKEKVS